MAAWYVAPPFVHFARTLFERETKIQKFKLLFRLQMLTWIIVWPPYAVVSCARRVANVVLNAASVAQIAARWRFDAVCDETGGMNGVSIDWCHGEVIKSGLWLSTIEDASPR